MSSNHIALIAVSAVAALSLSACARPEPAKPAVDAAKVGEAVKADARQLVVDFNAHDAAKAVAHDAAGEVSIFHGQPNTVGVEADLANTKLQLADPSAKITVSSETVDVAASGDMAVYRASYVYDFTDPKTKKPGSESGNWLVGYKLVDGVWKIAWNVVSDTPAAAPAAAAK